MSPSEQIGPSEQLDVGPAAPSGPQRPRWIAITTVVVLVALGLGGIGGFLIARGNAADAPESAATACAIAAELQEQGIAVEDWDLEEPQLWKVQAIGPLLHAAALENSEYAELGRAGDDLHASLARIDQEQFTAAMDKISEICAGI